MPTYRDDAVVLRTHKLGEADRIITLLTRRHGKVRAVARGVRRTSSKFGAKLEPFSHVDVQFVDGRSLAIITQAESVRVHGAPLAGDFRRYSAGQVMLETADRLVAEEREPSVQQFLLLVGALNALHDGGRPPSLLLDAYLLRSLAVAGYAPSCSDCARCGLTGPHQAFSPALGGAVCARCRPPGVCPSRPGHPDVDGGTAGRAVGRHRRGRRPDRSGGHRSGLGLCHLASRTRSAVAAAR